MKKTLFPILLLFTANIIFAQNDTIQKNKFLDMSFEELVKVKVKTASKKEESIADAPGIVTVVTKKEIKSFGANTLVDILHRIPSVMPAGSHLYENNVAVFRGDLKTHTDTHTLILLDGRPMREGITGGINNSVYTSFPIEIIEKIEIIRGPGSVLYGTNAFTGVINIITKKQKENLSLNAGSVYGSFNGIYGLIDAGMKKDKLEILISGQIFNEDGWNYKATTTYPNPLIPDTSGNVNFAEKKIGLFSKIKFGDLSLTTFYSNNYNKNLGLLPFWTYKGNQTSEKLFTNLNYKINFSENWAANVDLSYNDFKYTINGITKSEHHASDFFGEVSVSCKIGKKINLQGGINADHRRQNKNLTDKTIPKYRQLHHSAYLQLDYSPIRYVKFIVGTQANMPDNRGSYYSPRMSFIIYFSKKYDIGAKLLYAHAFRSPSPLEQYLDHPALLGNEALIPERIKTDEIQFFYNVKKIQFAINSFRSRFFDLISRVPIIEQPERQTFDNVGEMETMGLELETKIVILHNLFFTGSAMYQKNLQKTDDIKSFAPETMFKSGLSYNTNLGLSIGIFNVFYGKPLANEGKKLNPEEHAINLLSVNIRYKLPIKIPIEISIFSQNLLDDDFYFTEFSKRWTNTLPMGPGRTIYGKIIVRLSK